MQINVLEAPEGAVFTEGREYPVYGDVVGSSFVFDDNIEPYFLNEISWKEVE